MRNREPRQIVLTHWNAGILGPHAQNRILPELVVYSLLYDEVFIREEDLITNRRITGLLKDKTKRETFEEFLRLGLVKLLKLPLQQYSVHIKFPPDRLPISARAEEHERRRSYKGRMWKATTWEWELFKRLDSVVAEAPSASRFHAPFPATNTFASELGEILENPSKYDLGNHSVFRYLSQETIDAFKIFCSEPEAWLRFLRDQPDPPTIVGASQGFYRTAAYQCLKYLPTPNSMQKLVESVYAASYCDRENSDGRYGEGSLIEIPYGFESDAERNAASDFLSRVEIVPTTLSACIDLYPGVAEIVSRTKESTAFEKLQKSLEAMASSTDSPLLSESAFTSAWAEVCSVYTDQWLQVASQPSDKTKRTFRYLFLLYVAARVVGFICVPELAPHLDAAPLADELAALAIEHWGPHLLTGFRAAGRLPKRLSTLQSAVQVRARCSRVPLASKNNPHSRNAD
jgi:hypothetical protein